MRKTDLPTAPLVLAFVLGPLFEQAVRRSLIISQGELQIFVTRPWSLVFLVVTVVLAVGPAVAALRGKKPLIEVEADE
jgi:putative tricarboxylic transport membrane protein